MDLPCLENCIGTAWGCRKVDVLGEPHVHVLLWPGVHEQHPVLARLLDHAHVQVVALRPPLGPLRVCVDHAGEEGLRVVAVVAGHEVQSPRGGDGRNRDPEAILAN
jgi:hypothetical protein